MYVLFHQKKNAYVHRQSIDINNELHVTYTPNVLYANKYDFLTSVKSKLEQLSEPNVVIKEIEIKAHDVKQTPEEYFNGATQFIFTGVSNSFRNREVVEIMEDAAEPWSLRSVLFPHNYNLVGKEYLIPLHPDFILTRSGLKKKGENNEQEVYKII